MLNRSADGAHRELQMDKVVSAAIERVATRADSLLWEAFDAAASGVISSSGIHMIFPRYATEMGDVNGGRRF
jgi:hypothetical protein